PYLALSYTWGRKEYTRAIQANGFEIPITANLGDAIGVIFADSICINQVNVHERGNQVRLMNTIYRSAEIIAIWLGKAADE
ncbi:heterokaryon incompatibility, partial [Phaeosphaeriaceae sp. PMI808]